MSKLTRYTVESGARGTECMDVEGYRWPPPMFAREDAEEAIKTHREDDRPLPAGGSCGDTD
ncbi:hypothetical protein BH23CHL8_BH23CHL8_32120 [soil metagenome]